MSDKESPGELEGWDSWATFIAEAPPTEKCIALDAIRFIDGSPKFAIKRPEIFLHCDGDCSGNRFFDWTDTGSPVVFKTTMADISFTLRYECRNCQETVKSYAFYGEGNTNNGGWRYGYWIAKVGEYPAFGPPVPSRVITIVGPDREIFLKGRRCENQGLGVGAFAYYRRVVESQKNRLLTNVIQVAERLGDPGDTIATLKIAKEETQFSKAMDNVKEAIPDVLKINGHNPLTLLHSALSEGLHAQSDEQCLELASSIRVVLYELADRIGTAMKDEAELKGAVSRLMNPPKQPEE